MSQIYITFDTDGNIHKAYACKQSAWSRINKHDGKMVECELLEHQPKFIKPKKFVLLDLMTPAEIANYNKGVVNERN